MNIFQTNYFDLQTWNPGERSFHSLSLLVLRWRPLCCVATLSHHLGRLLTERSCSASNPITISQLWSDISEIQRSHYLHVVPVFRLCLIAQSRSGSDEMTRIEIADWRQREIGGRGESTQNFWLHLHHSQDLLCIHDSTTPWMFCIFPPDINIQIF